MTVAALLRRSRPQPLVRATPAARRGTSEAHRADPERLAIPPVGPAATASLPFADGSCDSVVVAHDLLHRVDAADVLVEWRRVLKPGGTLTVTLPAGGVSSEPGHELAPGTCFDLSQAAAVERLVQRVGGFVDVSTDVAGCEPSLRLRATKSPAPHDAQQG